MVSQADWIWGVFWRGFSKISCDPWIHFAWCIKNKLFQIKARSMVHTRARTMILMCQFLRNAKASWSRKSMISGKNWFSKRFAHSGRPCRGLSAEKGFAPQRPDSIWLVEPFYALRVIQVQGEFRSNRAVNKSGERYDFRTVFRRFLVIH